MKHRDPISPEEEQRILKWIQSGEEPSIREIARRFNRPRSTVRAIVEKYKLNALVENNS